MASTVERYELSHVAETLEKEWRTDPNWHGWLGTVDHKRIGKRYLVTAFVFLLLGGIEAAIMRAQLIRPESTLLTPEAFNQLFSMHGITMVFWYAQPILSGFGNYLIPLQIGSRDMAFPRLNAFSYWTFLMSGLFVYTSFVFGIAPHGGWFAYVPYTGSRYSPQLNMDFYALSLLFLTISSTAGAINFIVTIFKHRCPGMSLSRMPLMGWSTITSSFAMVFGMPPLSAAMIFLELDRRYGTHFFDRAHGGDPLLYQHLFWLFGHPWVYIVILPATGMASMMFPTFCRRPIVGHTFIALATVSTGILGFGVWVHHMFATGMPHLSTSFFSAASMAVSVPSGIQVFAWLATIWAARRHVYATPFLFLLGFIVLFVIGGLSGVMTAAVPFDWQVTDTYFVVAHLHYVLIGINLFPVMAGFYYWLPKMTGRMLNETLGKWNFWVMFIGMNIGFFPMHLVGLAGMPRRIYTYPAGFGWTLDNVIESIGGYLFAVGVLLFIINYVWSVTLEHGARAGADPWRAGSLEWSTSSPPPEYNFAVTPTVASREPLWDSYNEVSGQATIPDDELPRPADADGDRSIEERHIAHRRGGVELPHFRVFAEGKEVLSSSLMDGEPEGFVRAPYDTLYPLGLAVMLTGLFVALLFKSPIWSAVAALATLGTIVGWLWPREEFFA
jgi:cytochrome c oxidase subunit I